MCDLAARKSLLRLSLWSVRCMGKVLAEAALALELGADHRAKMVLSRCLQRNAQLMADETLQECWSGLNLAAL